MKVIIAGSQSITDYGQVLKAVSDSGFKITEVISGGAKGVDTLAKRFAHGYGLPFTVYPADWKQYRKAAGPIRNRRMADAAEALIAVWDGRSPGTADMIKQMKRLKKQVFVSSGGKL